MQKVVAGILTNFGIANQNKSRTLLILHGWGQNASHWQNTLQNLPQDITGVALDLPAFGSTQPLSGLSGVSEYSDFVHAFIKKLHLKNVTLLGHSFGGQIAIDYSLRHPQDIHHLILVSPAFNRQNSPSLKSRLNLFFKPLVVLFPSRIRYFILKRLSSDNYLKSNKTQRKVLNKILYQDYSSKIKSLTPTTSIIWGDKDTTIPNDSKLLAEKIPSSKLYVIYNADHNPHLNASAKFLSTLNSILKKNA